MNINDYFVDSVWLKNTTDRFIGSGIFKDRFQKMSDKERKSLILHYVIDNEAFVFMNKPLLLEQVKQFLADSILTINVEDIRLIINVEDIRLIGSAKIGFSLDPQKYGAPFCSTSDLDFTIINRELLDFLRKDYEFWSKAVKNGTLSTDVRSRRYWKENIRVIKNGLSKGYMDIHYLPNLKEYCPHAQLIADTLSKIQIKLYEKQGIKIKQCSVRVYKNYDLFFDYIERGIKKMLS
ncbi:hypothetical protein NG821_08815 [Prevotella cerevisiae]|uniref:Uncharacterized protein n=1 Tax=Segatella cerevisiae TaxID=2053716 RepID=A0ABT1BXY7_9BACT|nr:hypothetical protein [Segatella cerevisiae]MCO6025935.1 hypothetical protein [Segatella cerevisiae]